jgi:hypothetical protein
MRGKHENRSEGRPSPWEGSATGKFPTEPKQSGMAAALGKIFKSQQIDLQDTKVQQELARLRESYRAGNAQLAQELSLPLDRYGYAI